MAHFTGWGAPNGYETVVDGDTWLRGTTGITFTWVAAINNWVATNPLDATAGLLIPGGTTEQHLAKAGTQAFNVRWVDASGGILFSFQQLTAADQWQINHNLRQRHVSVTVVPAIDETWYGPVGTVISPEVDFRTASTCILHFAYPVIGTALIRR